MNLQVSSSPHFRSKMTTSWVMLQVLIALLPALGASIYFFGLRALSLILNCVLTAIITEIIISNLRKKSWPIRDCSAALTGLLLALTLPPTTTWYAGTLGSIFAILVGKHIFGGLGANIFNPALLGRAFLMAAYPKMLTSFIVPNSVEAISAATPLSLQKFSGELTPVLKLFFGNVSGSLGETSAICLIIGGSYLLLRKIADWRIPFSLLLTVSVITFVNSGGARILFQLFAGGLLLGAFFMATDPVTTPITKSGRYIFGVGCGIIIMVIRYFSGLPEGVMYSILFMNALTPLLNRYTRPKPFGR